LKNGKKEKEYTLIICTSWSTELSPGNNGCDKKKLSYKISPETFHERRKIDVECKLHCQEVTQRVHSQLTTHQ
jgi:hypothetical protein